MLQQFGFGWVWFVLILFAPPIFASAVAHRTFSPREEVIVGTIQYFLVGLFTILPIVMLWNDFHHRRMVEYEAGLFTVIVLAAMVMNAKFIESLVHHKTSPFSVIGWVAGLVLCLGYIASRGGCCF